MSLAAGQTLSFYDILGPLGAGGMGEVYRARDTRLGREVAIKVLPDDLADDEERLRRFEREARTLASLSHANLAHVYGIDQVEHTCFMAMELVPGEDLATRLARGALPVGEAVDLCRQIAEGLETAHEAGVVHRDLKPANVRVTPEGVVKILDFGLAKPIRARAGSAGTTTEEPDSFLMTEEGVVLGTPTYMSPEQARGRPVDRRTDIWAFGCVLYECLTGRRAFGGESMTDVLAAIVGSEPDWSALPPETPPAVRRTLKRCLNKDPRQRLRDVGDARLELSGAEPETALPATRPRSPRASALAGWAVAAVLLALLLSRLGGTEPGAGEPAPPLHARVLLPPDAELAFGASRIGIDSNLLALSPDGRLLVTVGRPSGGGTRLYRQDLTSFAPPEAIPGTEGALSACFSPDGETIAFLTDDRLKRVSPIGDGLLTLCEVSVPVRVQWAADGTIYLAVGQGKVLESVSPSGGEVATLASRGTSSFLEVLPGGKSALVLDYGGGISMDFADILLMDLETKETRVVLENASDARFAPPGELVFARAGSLLAVAFDPERGEVHGEPTIVLRDVVMDTLVGLAQFALSPSGTLAFVEGPVLSRGGIAWIGRDGSEGFMPVPERTYGAIDLDPTDSHVAVQVSDVEDYVWLYDIAARRGRQLAGGSSGWPIWSSAGDAIATSADDTRTIRIESTDGSREHRSFAMDRSTYPASWSPDDRVLALYGKIDADIRLGFLDLSDGGEVEWLDDLGRNAWGPVFSPDGKWIAYASQVTGLFEIVVRSYPDGSVERQISEGGGVEPVWSPCGELFYRQGDRWMSTKIQTEPELTWSAPRLAFETDFIDTGGRSYDVTSDGQKLYVIKQPNPPDGSRVNLITDWSRRR